MSEQNGLLDIFIQNNTKYLDHIMHTKRSRRQVAASPRLRKLRAACDTASTPEEKCTALANFLNAFENLPRNKARRLKDALLDDLKALKQQWGKRVRYDNSPAHAKDYYSVAVIVKDEARNMREHVLFYLATGADRIYIYDNDSTDNLLEVLKPFIDSGYVVYQRWPGQAVQTAAYRDAIRRLRRKSTWLALIDADEFLFSPQGSMPDQLKAFEDYPGVGVNWVTFGPNGHDRRPEGLTMDNYTTTFTNYNEGINLHTKSIVQPKEVFSVSNCHFAFYKRGRFAVNEQKEHIDNYAALAPLVGRAFTKRNYHDVFRINHYWTRSLEDLEEKHRRGFASGRPRRSFDAELNAFRELPMSYDYTIEPYADMVRAAYDNR